MVLVEGPSTPNLRRQPSTSLIFGPLLQSSRAVLAESPPSVRSIDVRRQVSASVLPCVVGGRSACKHRPIVEAESPLMFGLAPGGYVEPSGGRHFPPER